MQLLRKVASFGASLEEKKIIYILFIRSILEQSCEVWHSKLTDENETDLERVQKTAAKIMLKNKYKGYKDSLKKLNIKPLIERREHLCLNFARKRTKNNKMNFSPYKY